MTDTPISVPFPELEQLQLRLSLGSCRLTVRPGEHDEWVSGSYHDPTGDLGVRVIDEGNTVRITQDRTLGGMLGLFKGRPHANLTLGAGRPFRLVLETGASENELELGGLPLTSLSVRAGAGKVDIEVSSPNPQDMGTVEFQVGAGGLEGENLGNLNARSLKAEGGAASIELDFSGSLRQPLDARISAGLSGLEITVPIDRPVRLATDATLGEVDVGDGFVTREGAVWSEGADPSQPVAINLYATVALGGMKVRGRRGTTG